jgi:hypothetical protein
MNARFRVVAYARILLIVGVLTLALEAGVRADAPSRAGLVIVYAPDDVRTTCVTFDSDEVTGLELLQRAGLDVIQAGTAGVGASVCKIDAVGCDYPGEHCFCQCLSTPCTFWSYWYWQNGDWAFSQWGASSRRVTDGAVEAWVWGDGQTPPPAIDLADERRPFASICPAPPQLSSPANQDGYPGPDDTQDPQPTADTGAYPGPDEGEPSEPTPEAEPTGDELLPPTVVPREDTPSPEESAEPEATPSPTPSDATPGATSTPTRAATRTPTATATATVGPTLTPSPTAGPTATPTDDGMAAAIATAVTRSRATPSATGGGSGVGGYVAFALLALVLIALIVYAVLLRRQRARGVAE